MKFIETADAIAIFVILCAFAVSTFFYILAWLFEDVHWK